MQREDKQPLYKTRPAVAFSIALGAMFAFLIPAFFIFGFYDYFLQLENWRIIYSFVVVASVAAWVIAIIYLTIHSINEIKDHLTKYKRWRTRLKHINFGGVMFVLVSMAGITLFYFFMTAIPMYKDLKSGVKKEIGVCMVQRQSVRGPDNYYIYYRYKQKDELKLYMSRSDFYRFKGERVGFNTYECRYDLETFYVPNSRKAIYIRGALKNFRR